MKGELEQLQETLFFVEKSLVIVPTPNRMVFYKKIITIPLNFSNYFKSLNISKAFYQTSPILLPKTNIISYNTIISKLYKKLTLSDIRLIIGGYYSS